MKLLSVCVIRLKGLLRVSAAAVCDDDDKNRT